MNWRVLNHIGVGMGATGLLVFVYSLFISGARPVYLLSLGISFFGLVIGMFGIVSRKGNRLLLLCSILSVIPYLFLIFLYYGGSQRP